MSSYTRLATLHILASGNQLNVLRPECRRRILHLDGKGRLFFAAQRNLHLVSLFSFAWCGGLDRAEGGGGGDADSDEGAKTGAQIKDKVKVERR